MEKGDVNGVMERVKTKIKKRTKKLIEANLKNEWNKLQCNTYIRTCYKCMW